MDRIARLAILTACLLGIASQARSDEPKPPEPAPGGGETAEAPRRPLLWVIEGDTPTFLFGTIHLTDPRVLDLADVVVEAFESADEFQAEIPMDAAAMMGAQALMLYGPDRSLDKVLPPELYQRVVPHMAELGVPAMVLPRLKAWVVGMQLMMKALSDAGDDEGADDGAGSTPAGPVEVLDQMLYSRASKAGKTVGGLETVREQLTIFDSMEEPKQVEMLEEILDMLEADPEEDADAENEMVEQVRKLTALYLAGDLVPLARLLKEAAGEDEVMQEFMRRLIDDRNERMADRILERTAAAPDKVFFFAVGAGHYPGPEGILARLAAAGKTVRRLEIGDEVPKAAATAR